MAFCNRALRHNDYTFLLWLADGVGTCRIFPAYRYRQQSMVYACKNTYQQELAVVVVANSCLCTDFSPLYLGDIDKMFEICVGIGPWFAFWNPLAYIGVAAVLFAFVEINKRMQYRCTYLESSNVESRRMKTVTEWRMFDRYGEIGQYLKLEVKSLMRNKNIRKSFIYASVGISILSLVISLTDLYQDDYSRAFWAVYTFVLYGSITLIKIMSAEGNYIDCLVIHKENIMQLLRAKYYLYGSILILPFLLMLPTVFTGKYTFLALFQ